MRPQKEGGGAKEKEEKEGVPCEFTQYWNTKTQILVVAMPSGEWQQLPTKKWRSSIHGLEAFNSAFVTLSS